MSDKHLAVYVGSIVALMSVGIYGFKSIRTEPQQEYRLVIDPMVITIESSSPPPPPGPSPPGPIPPGPPEPEDRFGLEDFVRSSLAGVNDPEKDSKASRLAEVFHQRSRDILGGRITTVDQLVKMTFEANQKIATPPEVWFPFSMALNDRLEKLNKQNLTTMNDFAIAWEEISRGLK